MGQRPLSVAQVVDRLRSGSAASAAEACVALDAVVGQCEFVKKRLGKDLRCAPLATVAVGAGLIPLLVRLLAKGGYTAGWACWGLLCTCTSGSSFYLNELTCSKGDIAGARAAFLASGGVEAAVKLLELTLRHPRLVKMKSILFTARVALHLFDNMAADFNTDRNFKSRCIDAGIVPTLLHFLEHENSFNVGLVQEARFPSIANIICYLCYDLAQGADGAIIGQGLESGKVVTAIVTSFWGGGLAPLLVGRLQLSAEG